MARYGVFHLRSEYGSRGSLVSGLRSHFTSCHSFNVGNLVGNLCFGLIQPIPDNTGAGNNTWIFGDG